MEVIGAVAGVVGLVSSVARVATTLSNLQQRYSYAALNITFIASSLWTTKAALEAIGAWRASSTDTSQSSQQLDIDVDVSLQSCALLVAIIERKLVEMKLDQPTFLDKARFLALDDIYKDFTSNLDSQIRALHLLLTIYQCRTSAEQKAKLDNQQTRIVFRQVQDSTASLHLENQDLQDAASILSEDPSVNFSVDAILLNTPLYQRVYKKRSSDRYAQTAVPTPRSIPRKPLRHTKSISASSEGRSPAERPVDPFLAENLHLPFLGVRFVGEPSEPILEEDADNIKDDEVKEPLVKERGHVVAFVENDPEPEVNTESSASVQPTSQKTTTVSNEPSGATELDPVVEVATAMASGPGEVLPCSEVPMTEATSVLDDSTKSSPLNSGPQVSSAKLATPPDPLETPRSEIGSEPTQEQRLSAESRSPSTSEHSIYRVSSDHRFRKSTVSANAEIDPHISDKGKYEGIGTFSINFGPSPTLDIADLQPINQTGTERSPQTELPDIKIDDMDNTSISHRSSDGNSPDRPIPAGMPAPKRPPPPIPIVVPDFEVAAGLGSSDHSMGMQSPRALRSVGEGDIEARTTSSNQSSESSLRSLSRDSAASTPYTSIPSTARSQSSTLPASSLTQVGATVRATQAGEAGVKPRASRQFSKEMIIKSVSALQRNHLSETTSNTSTPRKLSKRPLMALLSIGGRSKQTEKSSAVYAAAATGNSEYLLQLLEANPKLINTTTSQICASGLVQPRTPLMCATIGGHLDCVDILRSFGADTGMSDKQGKTALHLAVEAGQLGAVTRLLQPVFDGEAGGPRPRSTNGSTNGVAELDGSNPLPRTTERRVPIIKRASTEARASLEATDHLGRTPLHYAVIERKEAIVAALVANGAVVDALDANKETPLIWAVKQNDANSMFTLTAAGANTKHRDIKGDSLLSHAARLGRLNILEMMATQQADLELKNLSGERPLHVACLNDRSTVVYTLLQKRVEVNSWTEPPASKPNMYFPRPACGQRRAPSLSLPATSLHLACLHGFFDVGAILLKHGAWVNAALEDTRTPLMLAVDSGNAQLVSLLLENGAKVNAATSKECLTALHLSCRNGDLEITRMLVSYGANTFALTRGGSLETPPRHALSCHNGNIPLNQRAAVNYVQEINQAHARQTGRLIVGPSRLPGNEESYASGYGLTPSNDGFPAGSQQPPPPYSQSPSTAASKTQFR